MHTSVPPPALFAMNPVHLPELFPPPLLTRLQQLARVDPTLVAQDFSDPAVAEALGRAEVLVTGWGCPHLGAEVLAAAPRLRAVLHAGGSVRHLVGEPFWERGLTLSSAVRANALPVAEYTLAAILLAGKDAFGLRERFRAEHVYPAATEYATVGNLGRRVGLIGASRVGRRVLELLRPFELSVSLHDPYVDAAEAAELGAVPLGLDELLRTSDIVSVHAPDTPQTHHMLNRERLALIPDGGVLINTSRGALVDHTALTEELVNGRLSAILDVTDPEPLPADSPLYRLPNVFLTPHIAGSLGNELARLGGTVVTELERLTTGLPPAHPVHRAELAISA
ncbi:MULTISPECIES: hydroxyacid dehydrogenase [Streptomyces]|uniref:Hydroxyacid dehydrogenase n=4 Tax=Streptomyces TaxID=1883 RepID=A0AAP6BG12_9ACTN|nr:MULTISPECIES: hydroxyacid dehydrogenase [Streptomyces]MBZ3912302.1 hydroxyacid dehydrogenase [Streptomyces acidiscabies]MDW8471414.1 hydroxyacid dehydrogenase [Streptomyces scabiei]MDX2565590.1 hydroxyacid dehydrogenase [Streptomyces scabiei]MDX2625173.1 hydroxyacid dehydrogenase [Streptomyces scabiei]MDX2690459.1 hydroxyacid dehydrogenase [Streptomyces scabiei]